MRLADFLLQNMESILIEWDAFAASASPAAGRMDHRSLRDHAPEILRAIALDLRTEQTAGEQDQKAKGRAPMRPDAAHTAAQTHATLRAQGGFNIVHMAAEYRALRASVLRLWAESLPQSQINRAYMIGDMTRFNEAIDQALLESVDFFTREVEDARHLFLGVLGHDLRNPLETIQVTANLLDTLRTDPVVCKAAARLMRSAARMKNMLDDLLDYNQTTLAGGISVSVTNTNLGEICATNVDDFCGALSDRVVQLEVDGNTQGRWDVQRLHQLLSNLLSNAFAYGRPDAPIRVQVRGEASAVHLAVRNQGPPIPDADLPYVFEPLKRGATGNARINDSTHLGLGLFIAREIAKAHGGDIQVHSDEQETVFAVRLPRASSQ